MDRETHVIEFLDSTGHREALPSFGRLIERSPVRETELTPVTFQPTIFPHQNALKSLNGSSKLQVDDCPSASQDYYAHDYSRHHSVTTLTYKAVDLVDGGGKVYVDLDAVRDENEHLRQHHGILLN